MSVAVQSPGTTERILFVPEIVAFGGGERIYLSLSRFLYERGIAHKIVSYYQDIPLQNHADWPLTVELISPERSPIKKAWALKQYFSRQERFGGSRPLLVGLQSALHAAAFGVREYALMVLDTPSLMGSAARSNSPVSRAASRIRASVSDGLTRQSLRQASPVIITTEAMAREIEELYGVRPIVSRQGVAGDPGRYAYRPLRADQPLRLLSVCRLERSKRIDWMLRSLAALEAADPPLHSFKDWRLDVVGEGSQAADLRRLADEQGLSARVVFHGQVSDARLEEIYGQADVFLMPAVQGYGLPALEALTRKIPVVVHAQSGVSEILGGTLWVEILTGGEETLTAALRSVLPRLLSGELAALPLPEFPTEAVWAEEVCRLCGWLGNGAERGRSL